MVTTTDIILILTGAILITDILITTIILMDITDIMAIIIMIVVITDTAAEVFTATTTAVRPIAEYITVDVYQTEILPQA